MNKAQDNCPSCKNVLKLCFPEQYIHKLPANLEAWDRTSRVKRKEHIYDFLKAVNCMLNGKGGVIILHTNDHCLSFWDEQVDNFLLDLIPDGTLFDENFYRKKIDDFHYAIGVYASKRPLSVLDFNSMISLNKGKEKPSHNQIRHLLNRESKAGEKLELNMGPLKKDQRCEFFEDANRQAKLIKSEDVLESRVQPYGHMLMIYCWEKLKLPTYIAAFSKQKSGGICCLGLEEEKVNTEKQWTEAQSMTPFLNAIKSKYKVWEDRKRAEGRVFYLAEEQDVPVMKEKKTGHYLCRGVQLTEQDKQEFKNALSTHVKENLLWYPGSPTEDSVICDFLEIDQTANLTNGDAGGNLSHAGSAKTSDPLKLYLILIKIMHFEGVCFQEKEGPEAYRVQYPDNPLKNTEPVRMPAKECCQKIKMI